MNKEIRWRQRFENFDKAFQQLTSSIEIYDKLSFLEKAGLIHQFESAFELAWKTIKDYLESNDVDAKYPREVIKEGFHYEIIDDGDIWMDMLEKRNLIANACDEEHFNYVTTMVKSEYYPAVDQVYHYFKVRV